MRPKATTVAKEIAFSEMTSIRLVSGVGFSSG
jgi:hypothetical protein